MEYAVAIYCLSEKFFTDYPYRRYPEIAVKKSRPYSCLLLEYMDDTFICIPFRSHIRHPYAYHFRTSLRSLKNSSGLDYTKTILLRDTSYLDDRPALVDQDEYRETMKNLPRIIREITNYLTDYQDHINQTRLLHPREFQRRYGRSTLPYFESFFRDASKPL